MTALTGLPAGPPRAHTTAGRALFFAGVAGAVIEAMLYLWPDQVPQAVYSNPFAALMREPK